MSAVSSWLLRAIALPMALAIGGLVLPAAATAAARPGDNEIEARWTALGGETGPLGAELPPPDDHPYDVPGGRAQDFANGSIYWSEATGAWDVRGAVRDRYLATGGPGGTLAFPTGAAGPAGVPDAEVQEFTGGRIYSSAATGARALVGAVLARYLAAGGPTGRLGLPTTNEAYGGISGSRATVFTGGRIYWSAATGAQAVYGVILAKYLAIGAARSYIGLPTTSEYALSTGSRNKFTSGVITYYSSSRAVVVTGTWRPSVKAVTAAEMPYTYRSGCPVGPSGLRRVKMPYYDWAGVPQMGDIVLRISSSDDMQRVFKKAFDARFPIRKMRLVDVYRGSDISSMAADNTSAFNCRKVTGNPYRLSQHSYGHAIDINTVENPYVTASRVYPSGSETYLNRRNVRKGMIVPTGVIARAMRVEGWPWGARWTHPDYQHFSANGG
jgi:uncharacterized protein with LGFP repeats